MAGSGVNPNVAVALRDAELHFRSFKLELRGLIGLCLTRLLSCASSSHATLTPSNQTLAEEREQK